MATSARTLRLSAKRARWVAPRKKVVLKGTTLSYNAAIQQRYVAALEKLVHRMATVTKREVVKLFETSTAKVYFAQDANIASQSRILTNALTKKFEGLFNLWAKPLAEKMIKQSSRASASALKISLKKLSGGVTLKTNTINSTLKTALKAAVEENVALIKSIAIDYQARVQKSVMRSITTGRGLQDLVPALEKYEGISKRHAKNMALDQTRKVYSTLNRDRLQESGVSEFEWLHSGGGQHPREEHIALSGQVFRFDDPPIINEKTGTRGLPAEEPNCGCTMTPVVNFERGEEDDE